MIITDRARDRIKALKFSIIILRCLSVPAVCVWLVRNAKLKVAELDEQHKVDVVDSGWMEYLTKELGMKDTDNVLWDLA